MENRNFRHISILIISSIFFHWALAHNDFISQVTNQIDENSNWNVRFLFDKFISEHGKGYDGVEEYGMRLRIFEKNLMKAMKNQVLDPTAVHGITPFSDLTEEEFESRYTGLLNVPHNFMNDSPAPEILPVDDLPANFDWRDKGAVSQVKIQGTCGSCWAFSTTGVIEGANFLATGKLLSLSEQQLIDCDHKCDPHNKEACDNGCNGGLMTNAYNYLIEAGGIEEEKTYPYSGAPGECKFRPEMVAVQVQNFTNVPLDENQIAANLVKHGPLAVGLNAAFMQTYIGGVSCPLICSKRFVNHGVLLVGYGERGFTPLRLGYRPYWIIKNSWGKRWGEHGYYKLCRGYGECGMNTMVSAVIATR
ncbi:probable cysteine protease RD19D [Cryptomeria japonica]|uniref:probable cysteine protease RD19D n=1 Tax=Cryptomeria japonica TaxID=3369 RepID=UPI0027DA8B3C|nr:probable cysteine protease RD19D [Cryptomeria japonica]